MAEQLGLRACGLEKPGHAMSRLLLADGNLDVETTCPEWFRVRNDPRRSAEAISRATAPASGNAKSELRPVDDVELVAVIYYNRGVELLALKQYDKALAANAKALRLDPRNVTARGNFLATLNNWAIALGMDGRYADSITLLRQGLELEPEYAPFSANFRHVHRQWSDQLCHVGRFSEALAAVRAAALARPDDAFFPQTQINLYCRWARSHLDAGRLDQVQAVLAEARRDIGPSAGWPNAEADEALRRAADLLDEGRPAEAVGLLHRALDIRPEKSF
jgi:tetratricopeptide (TPR) repeat protein